MMRVHLSLSSASTVRLDVGSLGMARNLGWASDVATTCGHAGIAALLLGPTLRPRITRRSVTGAGTRPEGAPMFRSTKFFAAAFVVALAGTAGIGQATAAQHRVATVVGFDRISAPGIFGQTIALNHFGALRFSGPSG